MNKTIRNEFNLELNTAKKLIKESRLDEAFKHLENAHILGQLYVIPHTLSHLYMLKIGVLKRDFKEIIGQLIRIPLGVIGSLIKVVPAGNTGGSNVSMFKKMK